MVNKLVPSFAKSSEFTRYRIAPPAEKQNAENYPIENYFVC